MDFQNNGPLLGPTGSDLDKWGMSGLARAYTIIIVTNIMTHRHTGPRGYSLFEWPNHAKSHKKGDPHGPCMPIGS